MTDKNKTPKYAIHLLVLIVLGGTVFFVGLRFFVPEGSKLTGSYDAASLLYIADAPVQYADSASCGTANCHSALYKTWSEGAHGAREDQSQCEVCHGPQGRHPEEVKKLPKVRGEDDIVELCLLCHRKMKARSTTGQPQISPQEHPYPHEGVLSCLKCHDPHSPGIGAPAAGAPASSAKKQESKAQPAATATAVPPQAEGCFSCHGPSGRGGFAPVLAGQSYEGLRDKLMKFRSGELKGTMMNPLVQSMKDDEIELLSRYFAEL